MTQSDIYKMLAELSEHKRDKRYLTQIFIQDRLNKSVQTYYEDVTKSYESLKCKNEVHILRKLTKGK